MWIGLTNIYNSIKMLYKLFKDNNVNKITLITSKYTIFIKNDRTMVIPYNEDIEETKSDKILLDVIITGYRYIIIFKKILIYRHVNNVYKLTFRENVIDSIKILKFLYRTDVPKQ